MSRYAYPCLKCGKVVFYYDHLPELGEILFISCATLPDGSKPVSGDRISCQSCGFGVDAVPRIDLLTEVV